MIPPEEIAWSRGLWASLADDGVWGIPRSGLTFQKQGDKLVLIGRMPFQVGMPGTPAMFAEYQEDDYEAIKARFEAAGITVERQGGL
jgi:hypothetical protein